MVAGAGNSGYRSGARVDVGDIAEFVKQLRRVEGDIDPALKDIHAKIAKLAEEWSRWEAASGGRGKKTRQRQVALDAIKGKATAKEARVGVSRLRSTPWSLAAYWGAKRKTGWYGDAVKYKQSTASQFDPWVGKSWDVAVAGTGPYAINDALAEHLPEILDEYTDRLMEAMKTAFPDI